MKKIKQCYSPQATRQIKKNPTVNRKSNLVFSNIFFSKRFQIAPFHNWDLLIRLRKLAKGRNELSLTMNILPAFFVFCAIRVKITRFLGSQGWSQFDEPLLPLFFMWAIWRRKLISGIWLNARFFVRHPRSLVRNRMFFSFVIEDDKGVEFGYFIVFFVLIKTGVLSLEKWTLNWRPEGREIFWKITLHLVLSEDCKKLNFN